MTAIETKDLTYLYSRGTPFEKAAVDGVSVSIEEGDFVGVIGHTGSGKSTFIQHLNGLLRPTSGQVLLYGRDIWEEPKKIREVRFQVGLVFQYPEYQLFEETVERDIAFGPSNMGLSPGEIRDRVREAADFVGLSPDTMQKSPFELSGGQKRRVAIAGVLAMRPRVLILDEPTAGLDPKGRDQIFHEIAQYHGKTGSTILLVSHSMEDVAKYAKHVLVINDARKIAFGTVDEVFSHTGELVEMGLAVPQITKIFAQLRARGFELSPHVYTVEAARRELLRVLGKGGAQDA
ncbi:energy-coupling factor transporter ATPase [Yanshouia hominis]|uniref:Energy-coupling factor transporter ATP-binding protein EcfA2 n=1 Tax=Yanshouia hominis TaxID=2763673 RepID=A0ABR7NEM4_9FIRM|nr:energy-coupling factor transporter ATPase [Yanshouia hominis]MBC8574871.1 energy-coupling factor transporter ATPase [Yanshouia hominis]